MKKLLLFVFTLPFFALAFVTTTSSHEPPVQKINWLSWEEMTVANAKNPKPIFVDVYTDWCGWCKKMDRSTFQDGDVVNMLAQNFYAVKLDAEQRDMIHFQGTDLVYVRQGRGGYHQLAAALLDNELSFPTTVILDAEYRRILLSPGYKNASDIMKELKYAASGDYKK